MKENGSLSQARRSFFTTLKAGMAIFGTAAMTTHPAFASVSVKRQVATGASFRGRLVR